jgi:hypothetical protein
MAEEATNDIVDVLAFYLFASENIPPDENASLRTWQSDLEVRRQYRQKARSLILRMEEVGVGVRSSDAALRRKRLDWILTRPATAAYSLDEDRRQDPPEFPPPFAEV